MMVRPSLIIIACLCLSLFLSLTAAGGESCKPCNTVIFKENKGQWNNKVLYKNEMANANTFFERDGITYLLLDSGDMKRLRHDLHREVHYKKDLDPRIHAH